MSVQHRFARTASVSSIIFHNTTAANPLVDVTNINFIKEELI